MGQRVSWMIGLMAITVAAHAQSWVSTYESALNKARRADWVGARASFKQAIAYRPEDYAKATNLPGPATERRVWRNGAAYSPNFLGAYAGFKAAQLIKDEAGRNRTLSESAAEFEALIAKKQYSYEAFYFLNLIYSTLNDNAARMKLETTLAQASGQLTWKVDTEPMSPEEVAAVAQMSGADIQQPAAGGTTTTDPAAGTNNGTAPLSNAGTRVATLSNKFALIIGNSETKLTNLGIASASDDAQFLRDALMANAGYAESNIDLSINATAAQMMASAKALADRIPEGATVLIFFSGVGTNLDGKDYLAGVDTESATDAASMASKMELYRVFMNKGARIFSFFQVNRPITAGRYFGMEVPQVGSISQMQATIPGESALWSPKNGKDRGIFVDAMAGTLADFHTNRIPVQEFGWQVFYRIRRGGSGTIGGGSRQTPTLPVLSNLGADSRF